MSREIKFRAYHKVINQMLDWDELIRYSNDQFHIVQTVNFFEDNELIFMQYTGLKDKNGVEIYEGDIINLNEIIDGNEKITIHEVIYNSGCFGIINNYQHHLMKAWNIVPLFISMDKTLFTKNDIEVIGNINENPELLEVE